MLRKDVCATSASFPKIFRFCLRNSSAEMAVARDVRPRRRRVGCMMMLLFWVRKKMGVLGFVMMNCPVSVFRDLKE